MSTVTHYTQRKPAPAWNEQVTQVRTEDGTGWQVETVREMFIDAQFTPDVYECRGEFFGEIYYNEDDLGDGVTCLLTGAHKWERYPACDPENGTEDICCERCGYTMHHQF